MGMEFIKDFVWFITIFFILIIVSTVAYYHQFEFSAYIEENCKLFGTKDQSIDDIPECKNNNDRTSMIITRNMTFVNWSVAFGCLFIGLHDRRFI